MSHQLAKGTTLTQLAVVFAMPELFKVAPDVQTAFQRSLDSIQICLDWDLVAFCMETQTMSRGERSDSMVHAQSVCQVLLSPKTDLSNERA